MKVSAECHKLLIKRAAVIAVALFLCLIIAVFVGCNSNDKSTISQAATISTQPRVEEKTEKKTETLPFIEQKINDATLLIGQTVLRQEGINGSKEITFRVTYADGKETKREKISETILSQPLNRIILVGTNNPNTSHGYSCTQDCSGHEAGYAWAEENGITDPADCGGNSESFIEGCQAYAEEQQAQQAEEESSDY